jgi:hypothetical protein
MDDDVVGNNGETDAWFVNLEPFAPPVWKVSGGEGDPTDMVGSISRT